MKTISISLFSFEELSREAQDKAIEQVRQKYYEYNNFAEWAIDDCALLEPPHKELHELFGDDYDFPLIENTRENIYFSTDRNWYLDCVKAMKVTNDEHFLKWLGIEGELAEKTDYKIYTPNGRNSDTTIEFIIDDDFPALTNEEQVILANAEEKFNQHINDCLKRIERDIDYRFTDESIIDDIKSNDYDFLEDGTIY